MICPNCYKEVDENNFCTNCGYNLKLYNKIYPLVQEKIETIITEEFIENIINIVG